MPHAAVHYSPLVSDDEASEELQVEHMRGHNPRVKSRRVCSWIMLCGLIVSSSLTSFFFGRSMQFSQLECAKKLSVYSPALDAVSYRELVFNGTFDYPSIYRGSPNAQIDTSWETLLKTTVKTMRISKEELVMFSEDRPSIVKVHRDGEEDGYMATLEIGHQLHCVDLLRKNSYLDYYEKLDPSAYSDREIYRTHIDHCLEMMRQIIMCTGDVGIITFDWVKGHKSPYPNFNTRHMCRNWDHLLEWYQKVPHEADARIHRTDDVIELLEGP